MQRVHLFPASPAVALRRMNAFRQPDHSWGYICIHFTSLNCGNLLLFCPYTPPLTLLPSKMDQSFQDPLSSVLKLTFHTCMFLSLQMQIGQNEGLRKPQLFCMSHETQTFLQKEQEKRKMFLCPLGKASLKFSLSLVTPPACNCQSNFFLKCSSDCICLLLISVRVLSVFQGKLRLLYLPVSWQNGQGLWYQMHLICSCGSVQVYNLSQSSVSSSEWWSNRCCYKIIGIIIEDSNYKKSGTK